MRLNSTRAEALRQTKLGVLSYKEVEYELHRCSFILHSTLQTLAKMKLLLSTSLSAFVATALASPSVNTEAGTVKGAKCSGGQDAVFYKGIPFAEPPVGKLRFEPPRAYSGKYSDGVLNATAPAPSCIQFGDQTVPSGAKSEDWFVSLVT